jgi:DNA-binding transcriptional regulator YdaS (Cro superfamily)
MDATTTTPLDDAITRAGGTEAKLAARIGYSQVAVNKAKRRGEVTAEMAVAIDKAGLGSKHVLRPDLFGPAHASEPVPPSAP